MNRPVSLALLVLLLTFHLARAEIRPLEAAVEKGTVSFRPAGDEKNIPPRYRLPANHFNYQMRKLRDLPLNAGVVYQVTFPSPVKSPSEENNTVYGEYFRPPGKGPFPCVILLDILAGDERLPRLMAAYLSQHKIAGLYVPMAYYGPRRPKNGKRGFLSPDIPRTFEAIRQTVLDLRRATAWMGSRPELDPRRLGIMGTSLGSFMAALAAEMEPRLGRVAVLLGGGGFVDGYYDDPRGKTVVQVWEAVGGTREKAKKFFAPIDPITCAANLKDRRVLILAGKRDDVVPPSMAEALWKATGRQRIVWFDCTHLGAIVYLGSALEELVTLFGKK